MDFITFDEQIIKYPKQINKLIYDYYKDTCDKCNMQQIQCNQCYFYSCKCSSVRKCNVKECNKILCCIGMTIDYNERFLCNRCYHIDIYVNILEDIRTNGS